MKKIAEGNLLEAEQQTEALDRAECRVTLTAAGRECLVFRALLRQVLSVLLRPERSSQEERCQLVQTISLALEGDFGESEIWNGKTETEEPW